MLASRYAFHSGSLAARHCGWLWNDTRSYSGPCSATWAISGGRCLMPSTLDTLAAPASLADAWLTGLSEKAIARFAFDLVLRCVDVARLSDSRAEADFGVASSTGVDGVSTAGGSATSVVTIVAVASSLFSSCASTARSSGSSSRG
jgi:hypothetical protein